MEPRARIFKLLTLGFPCSSLLPINNLILCSSILAEVPKRRNKRDSFAVNKNTWNPLWEQPMLFPLVEAERLQRQGEQKFRRPHFSRAPAWEIFLLTLRQFQAQLPRASPADEDGCQSRSARSSRKEGIITIASARGVGGSGANPAAGCVPLEI